jgi:hypothetical protein
MAVSDVSVCAREHRAHRLQHAHAARGGAAVRDVPARRRGNAQVAPGLVLEMSQPGAEGTLR